MQPIDAVSRRGLWALPVWAGLLFYATFTHQPPYQSDFAGWSRYVTTTPFLVSHLVGSILGAGIGILGFVALSVVLVRRGAVRLAIWGLVTAVLGVVLTTAVFGIAAFAQPAIGRSFLAGHTDMVNLYNDVNGAPLLSTAAPGVLLLSAGLILYGVGVVRTRLAPTFAGVALAVGGPLFALVGVILADAVQSVGAALLLVGALTIARTGRRELVQATVQSPETGLGGVSPAGSH
ncbi:MAG: hypothetical protein QOF35_1094 [Actinomycetota bacterium]|jgi:hypothetical protein|nr:hypothetical protein [Actinomycetota bacterium]